MIFGNLIDKILKYVFYLIVILLPVLIIGAGIYCSVELYKNITATSQTFGEIDYHDIYEDFNIFDCDLSDAIFYPTDNGYSYSTTIPKHVDFNGDKQKYNVLINNRPSIKELSTAGKLTATNLINYYDISGNQTQQTILEITIKFYQSNVEINLSNTNDATQQAKFLEYLKFNGLHLRIIDAQYTIQENINTDTYTVAFLDKNDNPISVKVYKAGEIIVKPEIPLIDGFVPVGWYPSVPETVDNNYIFKATYGTVKDNIIDEPVKIYGNNEFEFKNAGYYECEIEFELFVNENSLGNYIFNTKEREGCYTSGKVISNRYQDSNISCTFDITATSYDNVNASDLKIGFIYTNGYEFEPNFPVTDFLENNCYIKITSITLIREITIFKYTISFMDNENNLIESTEYLPNRKVSIPDAPKKDNLIFVGWLPAVNELATESVTYIAQYKPANENLLDNPVIFDADSNTVTNAGRFWINETLDVDFMQFPVEVSLQVMYYDNKQNSDYSVLQECSLVTNQSLTYNDTTYENISGEIDLTINGSAGTINFYGKIENDLIIGYQFSIRFFSVDIDYFRNHIKIAITSIKPITL